MNVHGTVGVSVQSIAWVRIGAQNYSLVVVLIPTIRRPRRRFFFLLGRQTLAQIYFINYFDGRLPFLTLYLFIS